MKKFFAKWGIFLLLCLIWGSSFILMKLGMYGAHNVPLLSAYHVAAIRILSAGLVLFPFSVRALQRVAKADLGYIILSGLLGSFLPAFLFCIAETSINSSLTGILNALTPIFAMVLGAVIYKKPVPFNQSIGVAVGFMGCVLLFVSQKANGHSNVYYTWLVILATIMYGINVNMVKQKLMHIKPLDIASIAFAAYIIPCILVLGATGYQWLPLGSQPFIMATAASCTLGILGTAVASVFFYQLVKVGGSVFASMVTYGIPFVAIAWGLAYGEAVNLLQMVGLLVILGGVYMASLSFSKESVRGMFGRK